MKSLSSEGNFCVACPATAEPRVNVVSPAGSCTGKVIVAIDSGADARPSGISDERWGDLRRIVLFSCVPKDSSPAQSSETPSFPNLSARQEGPTWCRSDNNPISSLTTSPPSTPLSDDGSRSKASENTKLPNCPEGSTSCLCTDSLPSFDSLPRYTTLSEDEPCTPNTSSESLVSLPLTSRKLSRIELRRIVIGRLPPPKDYPPKNDRAPKLSKRKPDDNKKRLPAPKKPSKLKKSPPKKLNANETDTIASRTRSRIAKHNQSVPAKRKTAGTDKKVKRRKSKNDDNSEESVVQTNFDHIVWAAGSFERLPTGLYDAIKKLWPSNLMDQLEPEEAMHIAHKYHMASLPKTGRLKVLVLGESHSRTPTNLIGRKIPDEFKDLIPDKMRDLGHLNLVHCLSYGELNLLLNKEEIANVSKASTTTWWKVMATLAGWCDPKPEDGTDPLLGCPVKAWTEPFNGKVCNCGSLGSEKRKQLIRNKVQILEDLERFGIALMDISPIAIFLASGTEVKINQKTGNAYKTPVKKLDSKSYSTIMHLCWEKYMLPLITEHIKPEKVIVLGDNFYKFLERQGLDSLRALGITVEGFIHPSSRTYQQVRSASLVRSDAWHGSSC